MSSAAASHLLGKTIFVTGSSSGIGRSVAREVAQACPDDLKIIVAARRIEALHQHCEDIHREVGAGVKLHAAELDVSQPEQVFAFIVKLPAEFRDIDVLVNNAGLVKGVAQSPDIAWADIKAMFDTNVSGLINMTQEVLKIMKKRPDGGSGDIINIGSIAGRKPRGWKYLLCHEGSHTNLHG